MGEEWEDYIDLWEGWFTVEATHGHGYNIEETKKTHKQKKRKRIGFTDEIIKERDAVKVKRTIGFTANNKD